MKRLLLVPLCLSVPVLAIAVNPEPVQPDSIWKPDCKAAAQSVYANCLTAPRELSSHLTRDQAMKAHVHDCEVFAQFNYSECVHPSPAAPEKR